MTSNPHSYCILCALSLHTKAIHYFVPCTILLFHICTYLARLRAYPQLHSALHIGFELLLWSCYLFFLHTSVLFDTSSSCGHKFISTRKVMNDSLMHSQGSQTFNCFDNNSNFLEKGNIIPYCKLEHEFLMWGVFQLWSGDRF